MKIGKIEENREKGTNYRKMQSVTAENISNFWYFPLNSASNSTNFTNIFYISLSTHSYPLSSLVNPPLPPSNSLHFPSKYAEIML